jgi:drug/metabolite transporter (DMT)-like permease
MKAKIQQYEVLLLIILGALLGGGITTFTKIGLRTFTPISFTLLRYIFASLIILPLLIRERKNLNLDKIKPLIFVSLLMVANVTLFIFGVKYTTAIISQTLYAAVPLTAAIITFFLLKERLGSKKEIGLLIGFLGVMIIILLPLIGKNVNSGNLLGNLIVFSAVISFSFYSVLSKKLHNYYSPVVITSTFIIMTLIVMLIALPFDKIAILSLSQITFYNLLPVIYVGVLGTAVTYLIFQFAIKKATPIVASLTLYLQPVFTIVWASILLGEKLTAGFVAGASLALVGVYIVTNAKSGE